MTVNFDTGALGYFVNGEKADSTKCSIDYLKQSCIFNNDLSFIVGASWDGGEKGGNKYSNFDCYSCRLYSRILSDDEIKLNYNSTTNYHNDLVEKESAD